MMVMKFILLFLVFSSTISCYAFVARPQSRPISCTCTTTTAYGPVNPVVIQDRKRRVMGGVVSLLLTAAAATDHIELEPEPQGGMELIAMTTIAGCRMKQLDEEELSLNNKNDGPAFKFWMTGVAEGELIKEIRTQILKDASKKANFPGFRKGQVPPYAQPQITQFAVQESIIKTVECAVESYGLKSLKGSDGEVNVHEDVQALAKMYKTGDSITFTATLNASYDPEKHQRQSNTNIIDVEVNEEDALVQDDGVVVAQAATNTNSDP